MSRLLLHVCCAPCCSVPYERLKKEGFEITVYYENSNIWPKEEYEKRLGELQNFLGDGRGERPAFAKASAGKPFAPTELIIPEYNHDNWLKIVKGLEKEPEGGKRCEVCFKYRMEKTAEYAKENNFDYFAVSLTLSPHKNSTMINLIGNDLADKYGIKYYESNFKKQDGFKESLDNSKKYGFYRQNYCGCEFGLGARL